MMVFNALGDGTRSRNIRIPLLNGRLLVTGHPLLLFLVGSELASGRPEECSSGRGAYMLESILNVGLQSLFVFAVGVDVLLD